MPGQHHGGHSQKLERQNVAGCFPPPGVESQPPGHPDHPTRGQREHQMKQTDTLQVLPLELELLQAAGCGDFDFPGP
jgi:hypothetical protein